MRRYYNCIHPKHRHISKKGFQRDDEVLFKLQILSGKKTLKLKAQRLNTWNQRIQDVLFHCFIWFANETADSYSKLTLEFMANCLCSVCKCTDVSWFEPIWVHVDRKTSRLLAIQSAIWRTQNSCSLHDKMISKTHIQTANDEQTLKAHFSLQ